MFVDAMKSVAAYVGVLTVALSLGCFGSAPVHAQTNPNGDPPPEYRPLIDEAVREYEARHFEEARSLFARAVALQSSARAYRGLGMAEFELRNYLDSAASLESSLASKIRPIDGELRAETERLLARARSFLARFVVVVQPKGAEVLLDGNVANLSPVGELLVPVGDHQLEFRAAGFVTERQVRKINGGEQEQLVVLLKPVPTPAQVAAASQGETAAGAPLLAREDREPGRPPLYKNPWLWTAVGVVVVAAAVGLGVGLSGGGSKTEAAISSDPSAVIDGPRK
jgi:hypothetical protein